MVSIKHIPFAIVTFVSLLIFNAMFVALPFLLMVLLVFGAWTAVAAVALAGAALTTASFSNITVQPDWTLQGYSLLPLWMGCETQIRTVLGFGGFGTLTLGLLLIIGMMRLSKLVIKFILSYARFNLKMLTQGDSK